MIPTDEVVSIDAEGRSVAVALRTELSRALGAPFQAIGCRVAIEFGGDFDWLTDPTLCGPNGIDEWELDRLPFAVSADGRNLGYVVCLTPAATPGPRNSLRSSIEQIIQSVEPTFRKPDPGTDFRPPNGTWHQPSWQAAIVGREYAPWSLPGGGGTSKLAQSRDP